MSRAVLIPALRRIFQVVDAAISDGVISLMACMQGFKAMGMWGGPRQGNMLDGGAPFYGVYQTSDARFVSVGALEPQFFSEMIDKTGLPQHYKSEQNNPAVWPELKTALTQAFMAKTRDDWAGVFAGSDACVTPVLNYEEAPEHPHNIARGSYVTVDGVTQPSPAPRFSRSECELSQASQSRRADSLDVLENWGLSVEEISSLKRSGAIDQD